MEKLDYGNFEVLVAEAGKFHGDICNGISIGTRMTMAGLREIGITDPQGVDRKKIMVFVEADRCITDAIMALTGCRPGKRTMKVLDYGKMAATFINLETGKAVRVITAAHKEGQPDFATMPDKEMFSIVEVKVPLLPGDMPGKPIRRVLCSRCGETVLDARDIVVDGSILCKPCAAGKSYYSIVTSAN
jgi:formylmethanofuran dehydrogenase subunit E